MARQQKAFGLYMMLAGLFIASLVACNLIFQKFFVFQPFTWLSFGAAEGSGWHSFTHYAFEISVGLIPYPVTFLVTDLISEVFGRRKADRVVMAGLVASLFVLLIVTVADWVTATSWSPVNDQVFNEVFGLTSLAVFASMSAYLLAQFIDIRIFHFWKKRTNGKKLWLRNNFSTIPSQFLDTLMVLALLCSFGAIDWDKFAPLFFAGFMYKVLVAFLDTPFFYLTTYWARNYLGLKENEEVGNF